MQNIFLKNRKNDEQKLNNIKWNEIEKINGKKLNQQRTGKAEWQNGYVGEENTRKTDFIFNLKHQVIVWYYQRGIILIMVQIKSAYWKEKPRPDIKIKLHKKNQHQADNSWLSAKKMAMGQIKNFRLFVFHVFVRLNFCVMDILGFRINEQRWTISIQFIHDSILWHGVL